MGPSASPAGPALEAALDQDQEVSVRVASLDAVVRVWRGRSEVVPRLMAAWTMGPPEVRQAARNALLLVRPVEEALLPAILPLLESGDAETRNLAAGMLADLGPDARSSVGALAGVLAKESGSLSRTRRSPRARALENRHCGRCSSPGGTGPDRLGSND
jgi:hypothetical protein